MSHSSTETPKKFSVKHCCGRAIDDMGVLCAAAVSGSSICHFLRGVLRDFPRVGARLPGGVRSLVTSSPRSWQGLALTCCVITALEWTFVYARQERDHWNLMVAAAATKGLLDHPHLGIHAFSVTAPFVGLAASLAQPRDTILTDDQEQPPTIDQKPTIPSESGTKPPEPEPDFLFGLGLGLGLGLLGLGGIVAFLSSEQ